MEERAVARSSPSRPTPTRCGRGRAGGQGGWVWVGLFPEVRLQRRAPSLRARGAAAHGFPVTHPPHPTPPHPTCGAQVQKKKLWEAVQPLLRTDAERVARFQGEAMRASTGVVTCATLAGASIS